MTKYNRYFSSFLDQWSEIADEQLPSDPEFKQFLLGKLRQANERNELTEQHLSLVVTEAQHYLEKHNEPALVQPVGKILMRSMFEFLLTIDSGASAGGELIGVEESAASHHVWEEPALPVYTKEHVLVEERALLEEPEFPVLPSEPVAAPHLVGGEGSGENEEPHHEPNEVTSPAEESEHSSGPEATLAEAGVSEPDVPAHEQPEEEAFGLSEPAAPEEIAVSPPDFPPPSRDATPVNEPAKNTHPGHEGIVELEEEEGLEEPAEPARAADLENTAGGTPSPQEPPRQETPESVKDAAGSKEQELDEDSRTPAELNEHAPEPAEVAPTARKEPVARKKDAPRKHIRMDDARFENRPHAEPATFRGLESRSVHTAPAKEESVIAEPSIPEPEVAERNDLRSPGQKVTAAEPASSPWAVRHRDGSVMGSESIEFDDLVKEQTTTAQLLAPKIEYCMLQKKYDKAASMLQHASREIGGTALAELALDTGDRCRALGRKHAAINCYLSSMKADPLHIPALLRLADVSQEFQDTATSVAYLERCALLMRLRGDSQEALRMYRKIATLAPQREDVLELLMKAKTQGSID